MRRWLSGDNPPRSSKSNVTWKKNTRREQVAKKTGNEMRKRKEKKKRGGTEAPAYRLKHTRESVTQRRVLRLVSFSKH